MNTNQFVNDINRVTATIKEITTRYKQIIRAESINFAELTKIYKRSEFVATELDKLIEAAGSDEHILDIFKKSQLLNFEFQCKIETILSAEIKLPLKNDKSAPSPE